MLIALLLYNYFDCSNKITLKFLQKHIRMFTVYIYRFALSIISCLCKHAVSNKLAFIHYLYNLDSTNRNILNRSAFSSANLYCRHFLINAQLIFTLSLQTSDFHPVYHLFGVKTTPVFNTRFRTMVIAMKRPKQYTNHVLLDVLQLEPDVALELDTMYFVNGGGW